MTPGQVVRAWGRPHKVRDGDRSMFFDYCDSRMATFFDGKLSTWVAESTHDGNAFRYGEPWIRAPQDWGVERNRRTYMHDASNRGEIQMWTPGHWVVTDGQGNIVSWCNGGIEMDPTPASRRTPWG